MNSAAQPAAAPSTALVPYIPPPRKPGPAARLRNHLLGVLTQLGRHAAGLRHRLAVWPGWYRQPATCRDAWARSGVMHTSHVPADSQLLIFAWQVSDVTDRAVFFAVAILADGLLRKAHPRARSVIVGSLYHLAEHPTRRWVTYTVLFICLKAAI